ncbi:MAG: aminoglycoside phosphotransferase family protein [Mycobacterium sp.]|nr:aminoglycoside phosphotransferase family protein [Mycobacterium sp.]
MVDPMERGAFSKPVRRGATVERGSGPGNNSVHALLQHFERVGFDLTPRYLGTTEDGSRELFSYIDGETGYPPLTDDIRSDEALISLARAIRAMHDATRGFEHDGQMGWDSHEISAPVTIDCIGHRDLAPWNIVFRGTDVVGIIDWDFAGPSSRVWDLAYAAHQFVPFHPAPNMPAFGWTEEPDRARRLRCFIEAYGLDVTPEEIVDLTIVRLTSMAASIASHVRAGDPAFAMHARDGHAQAYLNAARYIIDHRQTFLA